MDKKKYSLGPGDYTLRPCSEADRAGVLKGFEAIYSKAASRKLDSIWDWYLNGNPLAKAGVHADAISKMPNLVLEADKPVKKIVGYVSLIPNLLKIGKKEEIAVWSSNLYVLPEHRGQSIRIVDRLRKSSPLCIILGVGGAALELEQRMGWKIVDVDSTLVKILSFRRLIKYGLSKIRVRGALADVISHIISKPSDIIFGFFTRSRKQSGRSKMIGTRYFGSEMDGLWEDISSHYRILTKRDSKYMNWKYPDNPISRFDMFYVSDDDKKRIKGVLILKVMDSGNLRWGKIAEMFTPPDDERIIQDCVSFSVSYFKEKGCDLIHSAGLSPRHRAVMKRNSFFDANRIRPTFMVRVSGKDKKEERYILDPKNWFVSLGDSDYTL